MRKKIIFVISSSNEIDYEKKPNEDYSNVPRLIELSWVLADENLKILSIEKRHMMIPKTVKRVSKQAIAKYGINMEILHANEESMGDVLYKFNKDLIQADAVVGVDLWMTKKLLNTEMNEILPDSPFGSIISSKTNIDILDSARKLVGAKYPNLKSGVRRPTLKEVVKKLTGKSIGDNYTENTIDYAIQSFSILKKLGLIEL